jgi:hypothetical protein
MSSLSTKGTTSASMARARICASSLASPMQALIELPLYRCLTTTEDGAPFSELTVSYCRQDGNTQYARPHPFLRPPLTPRRSFYYTPDQRIAVTGGTTCLQNDVPYDGNYIEFRTCAAGDNQQLFTLEDVQATVTSTTAFPDPTTICHNGIQQILTPANYVNVTQTVRSAGVCAGAFG